MARTILEQVKIRLRMYEGGDIIEDDDEDLFLNQLISEAKEDVKRNRQYPPYFTDEQITDDMKQFDNVIVKLVIYDYNKEGIEFESQDSENGYLRTYNKRDSILSVVTPLITVLT